MGKRTPLSRGKAMKKSTPAAFLSYTHLDDEYGHVSTLRDRLSTEVKMQIGVEFPIFQDRNDIKWGQNWKQRLEESLDAVTFLIPIITPSFFNSPYCRDELQRFLEREKELERGDLILPVYFVDTPLLNEEELRAEDELAQIIATRQYADWRELRFEPFTNPQVGKLLERLARQIRDALPRVKPPTKVAAAKPAPPAAQLTERSATEGTEQKSQSSPAKNEPPTRVVDQMHRGDFTTITEAIEKSKPGTRILIRPGFYQEGVILDKPLEIVGDGAPGEVVVQASGKSVISFRTAMGRVTNLTLKQGGGGDWFAVDITQGRLELEDCDITSQSLSCVTIHDGADPRLRRNRIHDAKQSGILIYRNGLGTLEDNDIFGNRFAGISLKEGSDPVVRRNRIYDNKENGALIYINGLSTLEDNDIFGNRLNGVEIREGGSPMLRRNRINKNTYYGIRVYKGGRGTFEDNNLRDNQRSAWSIEDGCEANVTRANNQE